MNEILTDASEWPVFVVKSGHMWVSRLEDRYVHLTAVPQYALRAYDYEQLKLLLKTYKGIPDKIRFRILVRPGKRTI